MTVKSGDWVQTRRHHHHGIVLTVYGDCPENDLWKTHQKGLTEDQLAGQWALIYTPKSDSVLVPIDECEPAEEISVRLFPDQIVIEAFGPTETEAAEIEAALGSMPGYVHRAVGIEIGGKDG